MNLSSYILPFLFAFIVFYALYKKVDVFNSFLAGAKEGMSTSIQILPTLIGIILAIQMFKASGGLDILVNFLSNITNLFGIPKEVVPLGIIRPISSSSATVLLENILKEHGPDSAIGMLASVINGSTETTFYTIAVYFSVVKAKRTGCLVPCSLACDVLSFILSCFFVLMFV